MSESPNEDAKRRERVRRVDALTAASRQPGEGPRLGTRIAGAVAVFALVAGATLGIGAWHSYSTETEAKKAKEQRAQEREQAAATRRVEEPPSPSASERKKEQPPREAPQDRRSPEAHEVEKPKKKAEKETEKGPENAGAIYSHVVLANKASNMCADLPGLQSNPPGGPVQQYPCNAGDADNQLWNISVSHPGAGAENGDLVTLANDKDNHCLDLPGNDGRELGTHVMESDCNGNMDDNQQWRIEDLPDGSKKLHNYASKGKCLQAAGNSAKPDARLVIGPCDAPSSDWYIRQ